MTARCLALVVAVLALAVPGASAAVFEPIGPAGGAVVLVGSGGHIVGIDLAARIAVRGDDGWRRCAAPPDPTERDPAVTVRPDGEIWVTSERGVFRGGADCARWRRVVIPGGTFAVVAAGADLLALQFGGVVRGSADGGASWRRLHPPARLVGLVAEGRTVVGRGEAGLVCSPDGGRTWRPLPADGASIAISRSGSIWSTSSEGRLQQARCGGDVRTVVEFDAGEVIGVDAAGVPVLTRDYRLARVAADGTPLGWGPRLLDIPFSALPLPDGRLLVSTSRGAFVVDGSLITRDTFALPAIVTTPAAIAGGQRLVAGGVFGADDVASDDLGATWHPVVTSPEGIADVAVRLDDRVVALVSVSGDSGERRGLLSIDAGETWRAVGRAPWVGGLVLDDPTGPMAWALRAGRISRSTDGGRTWQRLPTRWRPASPDGRPIVELLAVARRGGLLAITRTLGGDWRRLAITADGRVRRARVRGLPARCDSGGGELVADGRAVLAIACAVPYRSTGGDVFRRVAAGLPRMADGGSGISTSVAMQPGTRRAFLGRGDGLFVQERPGARWRRVPGAPAIVGGLEIAGDWLLVLSDRGLERMALQRERG